MTEIQTLYQNAIKYATLRHVAKNQNVPGTDLPYVVHLSNVAMEILMAAPATENFNLGFAVQVALLHDTVEDTEAEYDELSKLFGRDVADGVKALTKDKELNDEPAMIDSLQRIKSQPMEIWAIKLADRITNLQPPPKHWNQLKKQKYLEEARIIYQELKDGNVYLADRLLFKIKEYEAYVNHQM